MDPDQRYNSTFSSKGALLAEAQTVLREIDAGMAVPEVRRAVVEEDLLDRGTRGNRETVWKNIYRRYLSGRDPEHVAVLAQFVARCPDPLAVRLILFYESCQVDALLNNLTAGCIHELYQAARTGIHPVDVSQWLDQQQAQHPEIGEWSPTTRDRLIKSYLSTIRDFGLVTGANVKEFSKLFVPRPAFVYALYHELDRGMWGKALISSPDWRLFLLSERDVIFLLEDAANGGFVHFRHAGDVYDLRPVYHTLREVVDVITG